MIRLTAVALFALFAFSVSAAPVPADKKDPAKEDLAKLNGTWKVTSYMVAGVELIDADNPVEKILTFKNGGFEWAGGKSLPGKVTAIDPTKTPKRITYEYIGAEDDRRFHKAIYKIDGDTFTDCFGDYGDDWPTEFKSTAENGLKMLVYKRVKKVD